MSTNHICAAIGYAYDDQRVSSDLCTEGGITPQYRRLLHEGLDELLDRSDMEPGDFFCVGDWSPAVTEKDIRAAVLRGLDNWREATRKVMDESADIWPKLPDDREYIISEVCLTLGVGG